MLELPEMLVERIARTLNARARSALDAAAGLAAALHADEVGPEHLLCALMRDEECAASRAVAQAFADPETIADEAQCMAAGIMVTGSAASLPFSTGGVRALAAAHRLAQARAGEAHAGVVHPRDVLDGAVRALPDDLRQDFEDAGWRPLPSAAGAPDAASGTVEDALRGALPSGGTLFRAFGEPAKRLLSAAARAARQAGDAAIGPAHLVGACLAESRELEGECGLSASRARMLLRGRGADPTPPPRHDLPADEALTTLLGSLAPGTDSVGLLARFHGGTTPLLAQLLTRHRITAAWLEGCAARRGEAAE